MPARSAPQRRAADSASVSSTVWRSNAERLMTLRTSAVAVCCSRDSVSSRVRVCTSSNKRTFSIAITAWSAKVVTNSICLSVKGSTLSRRRLIAPSGTPSRSSGTARTVRWPSSRATTLPSGYASVSAWRSATWTARRSSTQRPLTVPRMAGTTYPAGAGSEP